MHTSSYMACGVCANLQHFDIELFCGFSLYNAFCPSAEFITISLLVLPLSQALVIKAG